MKYRLDISTNKLIENYHFLSRLHGNNFPIAPVLKSNAYGHGIVTVAKALDTLVPFFCVDSLDEALQLEKAAISSPILIMGSVFARDLKQRKYPFMFVGQDIESIRNLHTFQPEAKIHLFVDTGMSRDGTTLQNLPALFEYINHHLNPRNIVGLMSHFAASDSPNDPRTQLQVEMFVSAQKIMQEYTFKPLYIHIAASGAVLNYQKLGGNKLGNIGRSGRAIYGIDPVGNATQLKPILRFSTCIGQIKLLKKGASVGYDFTFQADREMTVGILPVGYYNGVDRRLSNNGVVTVNGIDCPIIGRVSMNITIIDLSSVKDVRVGQEVTIFSDDPTMQNSVVNSAKRCGTIPHELLVHLRGLQ